jgi:hypothetical protein
MRGAQQQGGKEGLRQQGSKRVSGGRAASLAAGLRPNNPVSPARVS